MTYWNDERIKDLQRDADDYKQQAKEAEVALHDAIEWLVKVKGWEIEAVRKLAEEILEYERDRKIERETE